MEGWTLWSVQAGRGRPAMYRLFNLLFNLLFKLRNRSQRLCVACGRRERLRRFLFILVLRFLFFLFGVAHFDSALDHGAFFDADPMGDYIAGEYALAANVQAVGALDIALHLAHDHNFFGDYVCGDDSIAPDGNAIVREINSP